MNEFQLQALLKLAADRLNTTPEQLCAAAEKGDLSSVTGQPHTQQAQQIKKILNDPEAAKKILSSPAAKKLLDSLNGKK